VKVAEDSHVFPEIRSICEKLGLDYKLTARLDIYPDSVSATVFTPNEHGSPYVDLETGEVVTETLEFEGTS